MLFLNSCIGRGSEQYPPPCNLWFHRLLSFPSKSQLFSRLESHSLLYPYIWELQLPLTTLVASCNATISFLRWGNNNCTRWLGCRWSTNWYSGIMVFSGLFFTPNNFEWWIFFLIAAEQWADVSQIHLSQPQGIVPVVVMVSLEAMILYRKIRLYFFPGQSLYIYLHWISSAILLPVTVS